MPRMAVFSSASVNVFRAALREYSRPAPCGEELRDTGFPSPSTT